MTLTFRQPINPNQGRAGNDRSSEELARRVTRVLREPILGEISFKVGSVTVSGRDFLAVANAVESGQIDVRVAGPSDQLGSGIAAYAIESNAIVFRDRSYPFSTGGAGSIVHEAVHAATDIRKQKWMLYDGEIAGFIAQAWYLRSKGQDFPSVDGDPPTILFYYAEGLAELIKNGVSVPEVSAREIDAAKPALFRKGYSTNVRIVGDGI